MSPLQRKLSALSRDRHFLLRGVLGILAVCILAGFLAKKLNDREPTKKEKAKEVIEGIIRYESKRERKELADLLLREKGSYSKEAVAMYIRFVEVFIEENLVPRSGSRERVAEYAPPLQFSLLTIDSDGLSLSDEEQKLFQEYAFALYESDPEGKGKAVTYLEEQAAADPPVRFANEFLGHVYSRGRDNRQLAITHFQKELDHFERSDFSRFQLLEMNIALDNEEEVRRLIAIPEFRRLADWHYLVELGIRTKSIGLITEGITRMEILRAKSPFMPLSLLAGLVWFTVLVKLGGVTKLSSSRLWVFVLAVFAGLFSGIPTLVLRVWQEDILGFELNGEFVNDLLFCISNIALREEISKLLLFIPLVPILLKRRSQIEWLIAAACVGLGFAIMENVGYFNRSGPIALTRMLTASFAPHFAHRFARACVLPILPLAETVLGGIRRRLRRHGPAARRLRCRVDRQTAAGAGRRFLHHLPRHPHEALL